MATTNTPLPRNQITPDNTGPIIGDSGTVTPSGTQFNNGVVTPTSTLPWVSTVKPAMAALPTLAAAPQAATTQAKAATAQAAQASTGMIGATTNANSTNVVDPTLLSSQTDKIISQNDPIMQRAEAMANEYSNAHGMLNSTMAAGAAQNAVLQNAIPIATGDVNAINTVNSQNAQATNQAELANAQAANTSAIQQAQLETSTNQYNAGQATQVAQSNAAAATQVAQANAAAANAQAQFNAGLISQQELNQFTTAAQLAQSNATQTNTVNVANQNAQNTAVLNSLDNANKVQLATIQANYNQLMQANSSAGALYQQTVQAITSIQNSSTMNADTKQAAVAQQVQLLNSGLSMFSSINNLNLTSGLDFSKTTTSTTGGTTTTGGAGRGHGTTR